MSINNNVPRLSFSDLDKVISELTRLQQENLTLLYELASTKKKVEEAVSLAQIEKTVYSGIRKYFK